MSRSVSEHECIQLSFPVNAAYVSAARLTASSIANRMSFEIDEIEDIKAAVSEACTYVIRKLSPSTQNDFKIKFHLKEDFLEINISIQGFINLDSQEEEMSLVMVKALMDKFTIECLDNETVSIVMIKHRIINSFD